MKISIWIFYSCLFTDEWSTPSCREKFGSLSSASSWGFVPFLLCVRENDEKCLLVCWLLGISHTYNTTPRYCYQRSLLCGAFNKHPHSWWQNLLTGGESGIQWWYLADQIFHASWISDWVFFIPIIFWDFWQLMKELVMVLWKNRNCEELGLCPGIKCAKTALGLLDSPR